MNGSVEACDPQTIKPATISERLEAEERHLTERLEKVRQLRRSLSQNSEIQRILDALTELGQYRY